MSHKDQSNNESWGSGTDFCQSWATDDNLQELIADYAHELSCLGEHEIMFEHVSPTDTDTDSGTLAARDIKQEIVEPQWTEIIAPNTNCANHNVEDWPGNVGFQVKFGHRVPTNTNTSWTYVEERRKLYTVMDNALPVHFITDQPQPPGTTVCIVAVFRDANLRLVNVRRCPLHVVAQQDSSADHSSRDHWILCDHPATTYWQDPANGQRNFLTVPFEAPIMNSSDSFTYRLRFMCRNSCKGTLERRTTEVFFILRSPEGQDLARRIVEVKVCACPTRDQKHDDMQHTLLVPTTSKTASATACSSAKIPDNSVDSSGRSDAGRNRRKRKAYAIEVYDRERYEFLRRVQVPLELAEAARKRKQKMDARATGREGPER
ncbi:cellular tumor antigen p53-like [Ornithodoros turicata]|uniref:cellular tumor antigen p53-like n=1 Tax=Ornithodoros turicata TaxID=34597 RepID=UPI003139E6A4